MRIDLYAVVAGVLAGLGSGILFQWIAARTPRVDFWRPAASLARSLVIGDDDDFFSRYGELLKLLLRYLGRQAVTLALPVFAVATVAILILPQLTHHSRTLPLGLKTSDVSFYFPMCIACGVGMVLPRRKH